MAILGNVSKLNVTFDLNTFGKRIYSKYIKNESKKRTKMPLILNLKYQKIDKNPKSTINKNVVINLFQRIF